MINKLRVQRKSKGILMGTFIVLFLCVLFNPFFTFLVKLSFFSELILLTFLIDGFIIHGFKESIHIAHCSRLRVLFILFLFVMMIGSISIYYMAYTEYKTILTNSILTSIVLFTGLMCAYYYFVVWEYKIVKSYGILAFTIGMCFLMVLPVGVVADEAMHTWTAYRISNRLLGIQNNGEETAMRESDGNRFLFSDSSYYTDENYEVYLETVNTEVPNTEIQMFSYDDVPYVEGTDYFYIIPSIGIAIGRLLEMNTYQIYYLGRIMNLLLYVFGTMLALKIMPIKKMLIAVLALLPVFIQQGMSCSYDVPINVMLLLNMAYATKLGIEDKISLKKIDYLILIINLYCLTMAKSHAYILIAFLPLLTIIGKKIFVSKYKNKILIGITCLFVILFISAFVYARFMPTIELVETDHYSILYLLQNPIEIALVVFMTVINQLSFYLDSFVGRYLGYLDITIPTFIIYLIYILLIIVSIPKDEERKQISSSTKMVFIFSSLMTFIMISAGMLIACSTLSDQMVMGLQGRYLLPVIGLLLLCVDTKILKVKEHSESKIFGLFVVCECMVVCILMIAI